MRELLVRWLYARCGNTVRYWAVVAAAQGGSSALVAIVTVLLAATFFDPPVLEVVYVAAVGATLTMLAIAAATFRIRPMLLRCSAWLANPDPSLEETAEVWAMRRPAPGRPSAAARASSTCWRSSRLRQSPGGAGTPGPLASGRWCSRALSRPCMGPS